VAKVFGLSLLIISFLLINPFLVSSLGLSVYVPEKYNEISAGERVYFEIDLKYPENPKRKDVELIYEIKNLNEETLIKAQALRAVETQASFIDFLITPKSMREDLYVIEISIFEYGKYLGRSSSTFHVIKEEEQSFEKYFYILFAGIVFIAIVVVIDLFRKRRDN